MNGPPPSDSREAVPRRTNLQKLINNQCVCHLVAAQHCRNAVGDGCRAQSSHCEQQANTDAMLAYLPPEVTGRLVPDLAPCKAASMELVPDLFDVPGLVDVPGRLEVPGLANPVRGLPLPVIGRTAWLDACCIKVADISTQETQSLRAAASKSNAWNRLRCMCTLPAAGVIGLLKEVPGLAVCATAFSSKTLSAMPCNVQNFRL